MMSSIRNCSKWCRAVVVGGLELQNGAKKSCCAISFSYSRTALGAGPVKAVLKSNMLHIVHDGRKTTGYSV
jgi:hypothetical protein